VVRTERSQYGWVAGARLSDQASRVTLALTGPLIGRARELECFRSLVEAITTGWAATLLIEGEAGIGKTRLLTAGESRQMAIDQLDAAVLGVALYGALQIQMLGIGGIAKCLYLKATERKTVALSVLSTP
jgi:hypothetical protein